MGINTSSPSTNLQVKADSNSVTDYPISVLNNAETVSTGYGAYGIDQSASNEYTIEVNNDFVIKNNQGEQVRVLENGNTGFGTNSASKPIQVKKSAAASGLSQTDIRATRDEYGADFSGYIDQGSSHGAIISTVENGTATERLRVNSSGLGINTTSPSFPLHVNGTIKSVGTNNLPALIVDGNSTNEGDIVCADGQALTFGHHTLDGNTGGFTEAMRVNSNGAVTKALQPAFSVVKTSEQTLTSGGEEEMDWQTEEFDVGSNFASNTFTAPVSGKYFLHVMVRIDVVDKDASYYRTGIITSNKSKYEIMEPDFASDPSYFTMSVASVFDMDAGDTAVARVRQNSGSASHIEDAENYTNFCGYLLG